MNLELENKSMKHNRIYYTCFGSVRGYCGVKHRHLGSAVRHIQKDQTDCESIGGFSDRNVIRSDGEPLSNLEEQDIVYIENMEYP
jgi:hypothetical protein